MMNNKIRHKKKSPRNSISGTGPARKVAFDALREAETGERNGAEFLDELVGRRGLSVRDARLARELVAGVFRHRRSLDAAIAAHVNRPLDNLSPALLRVLRIGAYQLLFLSRIPASAAVNTSVNLARSTAPRGSEKLANAVLRKVAGDIIEKNLAEPGREDTPQSMTIAENGEQASETLKRRLPARNGGWVELRQPVLPSPDWDLPGYLATAYSVPEWFAAHLLARFGPEKTEKTLKAFLAVPPLTVRVNECRLPRADLGLEEIFAGMDELPACVSIPRPEIVSTPGGEIQLSALEFARGPLPCMFRLPARLIPENLPAFAFGYVSAQDMAAAAVVPFLDVRPGMRVLDLCAAPGGKTLQIADALQGKGEVLAVDVNALRLSRLAESARRARADTVRTEILDGKIIGEKYPERFERVLLDAPCSNTGVMGRRWEVRWRVTREAVDNSAKLQASLLAAALDALEPGGRLVYSTCSLMKTENEDVVADVVGNYSGAGTSILLEAAWLPSGGGHEGGYVAVIAKDL